MRISKNYNMSSQSFGGVTAAFGFGYAFDILGENDLKTGLNVKLVTILGSYTTLTYSDVVQNNLSNLVGSATDLDFDLGATFDLPWQVKEFTFTTGLALRNLLGSSMIDLGLEFSDSLPAGGAGVSAPPIELQLGVSATRKTLWKFHDWTTALDFQNIGNNGNGSLFRTIHLGTEIWWEIIAARVGLYQGYPTWGLGIDAGVFQLDIASYVEEMGLNVGTDPDHRYAVEIQFAI